MAGGELVTTLADVLAAHQRKQWGQHDGWWECECGEPYTPEHQAEAVAAAGLAVIQLPRPPWKYALGESEIEDIYSRDGLVVVSGIDAISPTYACELAAAFLAAANAAESTNP